MAIYLSASSIKDYLDCRQRYYFRTKFSSEAEPNVYMLMGRIVHETIEDFWDDEERGMERVRERSDFYNLAATYSGTVDLCMRNFYKYFSEMLDKDDKIEEMFKFPMEKDVYMVGKFDRVLKGKFIIDWKTSNYTPTDISDQLQFIIYHDAFREVYGRNPDAVFLGALISGKLVEYKYSKPLRNILYNKIIPDMIEEIKQGKFFRDGLYKYGKCDRCVFKKFCFSKLEEEYELDSRKFNT